MAGNKAQAPVTDAIASRLIRRKASRSSCGFCDRAFICEFSAADDDISQSMDSSLRLQSIIHLAIVHEDALCCHGDGVIIALFTSMAMLLVISPMSIIFIRLFQLVYHLAEWWKMALGTIRHSSIRSMYCGGTCHAILSRLPTVTSRVVISRGREMAGPALPCVWEDINALAELALFNAHGNSRSCNNRRVASCTLPYASSITHFRGMWCAHSSSNKRIYGKMLMNAFRFSIKERRRRCFWRRHF